MAEARVPYRCDGCGQVDDHPKMHYGTQTYHHDCVPAFVLDDLTSESYYRLDGGQLTLTNRVPLPEEKISAGTRRLLALRDKAASGTRGAKLVEYIQSLPSAEEEYGDPSDDSGSKSKGK